MSTLADQPKTLVLLIEDDEDDYLLTASLLEEAVGPYELHWQRTAASGLAALETGAFDACLLDFRLSSSTGLAVLAEASSLGIDTPIIMLTGHNDRDTDVQVMRAGAADYLVKGNLDAPTLERSIRYAVDRSRTMRSLADSERRARSLMESASDGIVITTDDAIVSSWNPSAAEMFGAHNLDGRSLFSVLIDSSPSRARSIAELASGGKRSVLGLEGVRPNGTAFPAEVAFSSWHTSGGVMWSAVIRDVTERNALQAQLAYQAFHDPLTGLANRALLRDRLEHALLRLPAGLVAAVLFLDLDDFKKVNDTLGHAAGDELLQQVARRIESQVRAGDTAARLGGDEFAVVLEDMNKLSFASDVASRIIRSLREPFTGLGGNIEISTSIGIASTKTGETNPDTLLREADVAMYAAKAGGKNRYTFFEHEMHDRIVRRHNLERELGLSVARGELEAHYQPIVDLRTGRITGAEALMRWNHPERGLQTPDMFIPAAEESGVIVELGRILRRDAFHQLAIWRREHPHLDLHLSVNASPRELDDPGFVESLFAAIAEAGLPPAALVVEVTESVMLRDRARAIHRLENLRDGGVRIAIDDFGTGYCSLSYIHELPAEILKIDRSFIRRLGATAGDSVVAAIITMSHDLGLLTVGEGIDDESRRLRLRELGCDLGQGFHLARPAPASGFSELLATSQDDLVRSAQELGGSWVS